MEGNGPFAQRVGITTLLRRFRRAMRLTTDGTFIDLCHAWGAAFERVILSAMNVAAHLAAISSGDQVGVFELACHDLLCLLEPDL